MKLLITFLIIVTIPLCSQTYLNVHYNDGTDRNTLLSSLIKITFTSNGNQTNFYYSETGFITQNTESIQKFIFDNSGTGDPLPVELSSFTCSLNGRNINLLWETQTEKNSNKFEIQRKLVNSSTPAEWTVIGFVKASVLSNSPKQYSFSDKQLKPGKYNYRLKMIDNNGSFEYSKVIEADMAVPKEFKLSQNYPNPFNPNTRISYNIPIDGAVTLIVYDIIGMEVASLVNENKKAGSYDVTFDGSRLASGTYFCRMTAKNFTSSIKMIIIK